MGQSCGSVDCSISGSVVPTGNIGTFPTGQPTINLGFQQTQTIAPGNYNNITVGNEAVLTMQPGIYVVRNNLTLQSSSEIVVASPGTVTIYARRDVFLRFESVINRAAGDRFVFIYTRDDIFVSSNVSANAVFYARDDIELSNGAQIVGAVTARDRIVLGSASTVSFDANAVGLTDYGSDFCTSSIPPNLIAEWRLDALVWNGVSGEVLDYSGNNLHGSVVSVAGAVPATEITEPAIAGIPGTCRYGVFNGVNDGHVQINDPGTGSLLDLSTFTVSTWIYPRSIPGSDLMTIASKDENWEFHLNTAGNIFWWWGGGARSLQTTATVSLNTWQHIAITYEAGSQVIYINGVAAATNNNADAITLNNDPVLIGTDLSFVSRNFDGYIDELRIYDGALNAAEVSALMAETHACIPEVSIDSFDISFGSATASTCAPAEITITARTQSNAVATDYTGTVNLSTSTNHGDWRNTATASDALGTLNPANDNDDNGAAAYTFEAAQADQGVIRLNLVNDHAESLTITVNDSAEGVSDTSATLTFSENAFVVASTDSLGNDVVAGRSHDFRVEMLRRDPSTGSCGPSSNYNASAVKVWLQRNASDPNGAAPVLSNATASNSISPGDTLPAANNFTLPFVSGVADFSLLASDVGRYSLLFRDDSLSFSDQAIEGGSASDLVSRPFGFAIEVSGNPAAVNENGGVFTTAGSDFSVAVAAVAWQAADDTNNDGLPDGHALSNTNPADNADLSDNAVLASFGRELPAESITLSHALVAPAGGAGNFFSSNVADARILTSFVNGSASTSEVYFTEVGIIELQATVSDVDYLGAGAFTLRSISKSGFVGRFIPQRYSLSNNSITAACRSGFDYSYLGETFSLDYQLDALNSLGNLTTNYQGVFAKLGAGNGSIEAGARDAALGVDLSSRIDSSAANLLAASSFTWLSGAATINTAVHINRASSPDGPFTQLDIGVLARDSDGVTLLNSDLNLDVDNNSSNDYFLIAQTEVRFGRLRLASAFGPETHNLPVNFLTEYWDGSVWRTNIDDSCTAIARSAISFPSGTIDNSANLVVPLGTGNSTGSYAAATPSDIGFSAGDAGHFFTAPGSGNTGSFAVDIDLSAYPWLRFDWDDNGTFDDTSLPRANFTFGRYRGHDRIIYWQEVLQ